LTASKLKSVLQQPQCSISTRLALCQHLK
jgi:hypothetical protein